MAGTVSSGQSSDRQLLERVADGCESAVSELFTRYAARIMRFVTTTVPAHADAEDVVQHTFLAVMKHASTYRGDSSVKTWVFAIARNEALRLRRQGARLEANVPTLLELGLRAGWGAETPERIAVRRERAEILRAAIAALPAEAAEVLVLRDLEGLSGADTAAMLAISLAAQKSRLHRARLMLLAKLNEEGSAS